MAINPTGIEFGCNSSATSNTTVDIVDKDTSVVLEVSDSFEGNNEQALLLPQCSEPQMQIPKVKEGKHKSSKECHNSKRSQLLEDQTETQKNLYHEVKNVLQDIKKNTKDNLDYTKKIYYLKKDKIKIMNENLEIKKEKLKLFKENIKEKRRYRKEKLRLKNQADFLFPQSPE